MTNLLPEIKDGKIVPKKDEWDVFIPPRLRGCLTGEEALAALNNLGHKKVTEDFSDSPFADKNKSL